MLGMKKEFITKEQLPVIYLNVLKLGTPDGLTKYFWFAAKDRDYPRAIDNAFLELMYTNGLLHGPYDTEQEAQAAFEKATPGDFPIVGGGIMH
jgi:hypothetical protein